MKSIGEQVFAVEPASKNVVEMTITGVITLNTAEGSKDDSYLVSSPAFDGDKVLAIDSVVNTKLEALHIALGLVNGEVEQIQEGLAFAIAERGQIKALIQEESTPKEVQPEVETKKPVRKSKKVKANV